jgi:hypothetical protein
MYLARLHGKIAIRQRCDAAESLLNAAQFQEHGQ